MKRFLFSVCVVLVASVFVGCVGTAQLAATPTAVPTTAPIATTIPTALPSPQPTRELTPTAESGIVITDPTLLKLVNDAKADLTTRANVSLDAITIKSAEATEWRDSSLGCPIEGQMYLQVITPGYLIVLEAAGKEWNYHASRDRVMWCDK